MATEKQINFINKLFNERSLSYCEIQAKYEDGTAHGVLSDDISELTVGQASWVIGQLLDAQKAMPEEFFEARRKAQEEAERKYLKLIAWAKEHGVKVRKGMRKMTIYKKMTDAGVMEEYMNQPVKK